MSAELPLGLFAGYGIEIEHMIVDAETLDVRPLADRVLMGATGTIREEIERGAVAWSNELSLHVLEMKTNGPAASLADLPGRFAASVCELNALLAPHGARLLPTGMHPWMDPGRELRLWPHGSNTVYAAFDRIFGCRGHGFANLQSTHLNLPFAGDEEFARLHAAVRLVLPLLPALAASSPIADGRPSGLLDTRLAVYRTNCARVPSVTGDVIPETVTSRADYETRILGRIYEDLAPLDPEGTLRHEWVNARGAIARFDRSALEIRLIDAQECPRADLAIAAASVAIVRTLTEELDADLARQQAIGTRSLVAILAATQREGDRAWIEDTRYLAVLGHPARPVSASGLWEHVLGRLGAAAQRDLAAYTEVLALVLREGPLARRILASLRGDFSRDRLRAVYCRLADCLADGTLFGA
ncbi:glutamate--cysteine ligase [Myxococcota bacterium]|nr:glutamate--cysteine ligase [Myxococcota bacterium]